MNKEKILECLKDEWEWNKEMRDDEKVTKLWKSCFNGRLNLISQLNQKIKNGEFD
ncbi:hypothetical protein [Spiroplasma endosymbiont of Andrena trimmerana]|uniref:hypothetical protein n=1 Tax=Spiroplasma endosymbiont of Andrena trimmerana TaxID=3066316 RepID=UPI0030D4DD77